MLNDVSEDVKEHIDKRLSPMYKLTYKFDINDYNQYSNLAHILNRI